MQKKQFIFIDDSGDPGFKGSTSSPAFVMAAAVIMDPKIASAINQRIINLRKAHGWPDRVEFKFNKSSKKTRLDFLNTISKFEFEIYAVYINKSNYSNFSNLPNNELLYNWTIKELLSGIPFENAVVKIDGKYGRKTSLKLSTYLRQSLSTKQRKISKINIQDSRRDNLIQLADFVAGSIYRTFQEDKTDAKGYINVISNKIIELRELDLNNPFGRN